MSLVEILVALVILSVGMMGVALLFAHNLGNSRSALLRTLAVNLVSDMADRVRANANGRAAYDLAAHGFNPSEHDCAAGVPPAAGGNCSVAQLAEDDLARWHTDVRRLLPLPNGAEVADVQYLGGEPQRYLISVTWQEPGEVSPFSYESEVVVQGMP